MVHFEGAREVREKRGDEAMQIVKGGEGKKGKGQLSARASSMKAQG